MSIIDRLNPLDNAALRAALTSCCGARRWVEEMAAARPFASDEQLLAAAGEIWNRLAPEDYLEAFAAHPRIGDVDALQAKFAATRAWASAEQAGVAAASQDVLQRLLALGREYERDSATFLSSVPPARAAVEMLAILESRLPNEPLAELRVAAAEQLKITRIRLRKLDL